MNRATSLLLNVAHALDNLMLLVFATAVGAIALDFGVARWEDLMPYTVGAFVLFGLGSLPSGRLGDLWGRRAMMLVYFFGLGAAALLAAATRTPLQLAVALALLGAFASIYHPVGIPMLVRHARRPGLVIGINGLAGNLGIAAAAISTGLLVEHAGWRAAFVAPGLVSIACGLLFLRVAPHEAQAPARRTAKVAQLPTRLRNRVFFVMTATAITGSLLFNFTTNGNPKLLETRLPALLGEPARLGVLLALVYAGASIAQVVVGRLLDLVPIRRLMLAILALQPAAFALAAASDGWAFYAAMALFMLLIFSAIPFTDALIVRFVDDSMRSRVSGMRLAISFGVSSFAVWALGPLVKTAGFGALLWTMAAIGACSTLLAAWLPGESALARHEPRAAGKLAIM